MSCTESLPIQEDITLIKGIGFTGDDLTFEYWTGAEGSEALEDLTDWTATMVIKDGLNGIVRLTLSSEDDPAGVVLGGVAGTVAPAITHTQTGNLTLTNNKGVYQITIYSPAPDAEPLALAWGNIKLEVF